VPEPYLLSDEYVNRYADVIPPWGFNGLGYITYKRTYARPVFSSDGETVARTEEWHETVQRVVNGAQLIGADLSEDETKRLFDYIFFLKGCVAGRMLWQLGTDNNARLGGDSLVNCLGGETEVVTRNGIMRIDDLATTGYATVMTDFGRWVDAEVRCFGDQPLAEIKLRRGKQIKTVRATAGHRWFVRGKNGRFETLTENLTVGMKLVSIKGQGVSNTWMSPDGVRAGLVFGDGSVYDHGSVAFVASADLAELEHLFLDYKSTDIHKSDNSFAGRRFYSLPRSYKCAPSLDESRGYLYGWLAGYFAADGYARDGKSAHIDSTNIENLRVAKNVATIIGIGTGPIYSYDRVSNLTGAPSTIYSLPLHITDPTFFLLSKHRGEFMGRDDAHDWIVDSVGEYGDPEPVFCAIVPETGTFALSDNLLTGNCWFVDIKHPSDFSWSIERLMLGGGVGFSCDKPERLGVVRAATVVHRDENDSDFIVPDKREGWGDLIYRVMMAYLGDPSTSSSLSYSTALIRPAGTPIKTFGGTASGPDILIHGVKRICEVLDGAVGRTLTSVEVLDCMNIIGSIVVAGNVRRSAEIAIGSADDVDYLMAKRWDLGNIPIERAMSNNSIFVSADEMRGLPELVWEGYRGNGEPYGFINLEAARRFGRMGEERHDPTISGVNPCVTGDTWILTDSGPRRVIDLLDAPYVALVDGKPYSATAFWETGVKDVLKVETSEGYTVRVTSDHKILTPDGWVEAGLLELGDQIVIHDHLGASWSGPGSEDDGYVLGHLVGDGTFYPNETPAVAVWSTDNGSDGPKARLERIMSALPHRSDWTAWRQVGDTAQVRSMHTGLRDLASQFGIVRGCKTVTAEVEQGSSSFYVGFLRGLFDSDGHVEGFSVAGGVSIRLSQSDRPMLEAVQRMLARLGIKSCIKLMHYAGTRELPGGEYFCKESYRLIISGQHAERFMNVVGFENSVKSNSFNERVGSMKRGWYRKPMTAVVSDISFDGTETVYDCTVEDVHAFDANGIYVHNCAEIFLADRESCNLSEIFLPMIDSKEELTDLAILLYKVQKAIAAMPYLDYESDKITSSNMRLGLGVTGVAQALAKLDWLDETYNRLREVDKEWSASHDWPESVRLTTIKPSGTLSLLPGVTPGVHPGFSRFFVKRMRMASIDPLVKYCADKGFHVEPLRNFDGSVDDRTVVVHFPCSFPEDTIVAADMSAIEQLDLVRELQRIWADNSISVTVYYRLSELEEIRAYLCEHWAEMKSVSFLLHNEHGFDQAPMGELSDDEYRVMLDMAKPLGERISGSTYMSDEDMASFGESCDTGVCPVR